MNQDLTKLQSYPFEKLAQLKAGINPPSNLAPIVLAIGEPRHPTPEFIRAALAANMHYLAVYPTTQGLIELRQAIANWLCQRFSLSTPLNPLLTGGKFFVPPLSCQGEGAGGGVNAINPQTQILPVNGTREALFSFAQAVVSPPLSCQGEGVGGGVAVKPLVLMPNPFYQIYEGAALLAGAEPYFLPCTNSSGLLPDFDQVSPSVWKRCQLLYICSPGNPTGAILSISQLQHLISLAEQYNFVIAADECYSEIYQDEQHPPPGLLQAAVSMGRTDYKRCVVFHSLSKRSNCPGLRSGFVAGDAEILKQFLLYRTYHGCAMPLHVQAASIAAWNDEAHVQLNRALYRAKFAAVTEILGQILPVTPPPGTFYLWADTPIKDTVFAQGLFAQEHVTVLPGSFLSREEHGQNPGQNRVRIALTPPLEECIEAAQRIRRYTTTLKTTR